ncbi:hypothetical protein [Sorangium sp. So ce1078]|uniref:hypothetical protein n=1 Tax=Sorangium sp. So ce1078 TaxID=3133329 RepID=UPI003F62E53C
MLCLDQVRLVVALAVRGSTGSPAPDDPAASSAPVEAAARWERVRVRGGALAGVEVLGARHGVEGGGGLSESGVGVVGLARARSLAAR